MADAVDLKTQMNQLIRGYWTTQAIFVAAELRISDLLSEGPKSPDELGKQAGVKGDMLYRVLRALASIGILRKTTKADLGSRLWRKRCAARADSVLTRGFMVRSYINPGESCSRRFEQAMRDS